jgi:hypothetical protein
MVLADDTLGVGAPGATVNGASGQGAVYVFHKSGETWIEKSEADRERRGRDRCLWSRDRALRQNADGGARKTPRSMTSFTKAQPLFSDKSMGSGGRRRSSPGTTAWV